MYEIIESNYTYFILEQLFPLKTIELTKHQQQQKL